MAARADAVKLRQVRVSRVGNALKLSARGDEEDRIASDRPVARVPAYGRDLPRLTAPILFETASVLRFTELRAAGGSGMVPKPVDFAKLTIELTNVRLNCLMRPRR